MFERHSILITGVTGLIGGELAFDLADAGHQVFALVRASSHQEAAAKVAHRASRSGRVGAHRITPLPGDLTTPYLGLSDEDAEHVQAHCQVIIHAAAETRFTAHSSLAPTNIYGTQNLLAFAKTLTSLRRFLHVSSAAVTTAPHHQILADDCLHAGFQNEYVRTKRAAELLVIHSGLPVCIARPSIVVSAGIKDREFARSILWAIPLAFQQGWLPLKGDERLDIIPVALTTTALKALALANRVPLYCNISAGSQASASCREIAEAMSKCHPYAQPIVFQRGTTRSRPIRSNKALDLYLPFIAADVVYENTTMFCLPGIFSDATPRFTSFMSQLLRQITPGDAALGSETA